MANEDYKNGKIPEIVRQFDNTGNKYEINGIDKSLANFFYRIENGKFNVIPKGSYTVTDEQNTSYLNITDSELLEKVTEFQIVYFYEQVSSRYDEEFPDLTIAVSKMNDAIDDIKNLFNFLKSSGMIADTNRMTKVLSELEPMTVWYLNENGEIANLPISELYDKFQGLVDSLYREIKELLISDYDKFTTDMDSKTAELKKELENLEKDLEELLTALSNKEQEKINSLSTKVQGDISSVADAKKNEVITDIENTGDEEKKELNDHTLEKKKELDEYIDLNKESLIGPRGPRGYSISSVKLLEETEFGNRYEVAIENGSVVGTFLAPKGLQGNKGDKGDSIVGPQGDSIGTIVFNKIVEQGYEYDVLLNNGEKIGTFIAPKGPQGESIVGPPGPQGNPGAVVEISGQYVFSVNNDGHLILSYEDGTTPPDFKIDENGHLILTLE